MHEKRSIIVTSNLSPLTACGFALAPDRDRDAKPARKDSADAQFTVPVRPGQVVHDQNGEELGNLVSLLVEENTERVLCGVIAVHPPKGRERSIVAPWTAFDVVLAEPSECSVVMRRSLRD